MNDDDKSCGECKNRYSPINKEPCSNCFLKNDRPNFIFDSEPLNEDKNEHYQTEHQPIEVMQANMTHDEFIGYLKGNITKYVLRMGRKDDVKKEAAKIRRYAQWLKQAVNGETINPRK